MKILFDQGTPVPLRRVLVGSTVQTAFELGWQELENGELLAMAESEGFDLLITTDQNLRYQQNLVGRRIAIMVLLSTSWPRIQIQAKTIQVHVTNIVPGTYVEIQIP